MSLHCIKMPNIRYIFISNNDFGLIFHRNRYFHVFINSFFAGIKNKVEKRSIDYYLIMLILYFIMSIV